MSKNKNSEYKILLADDEPDILDFLSYNLKKEGFDVYTANDGVKALKLAKKIIPHLIILDVMMPNMDGITACEEMNKIPSLDDSIKIFLTARSEDYSQIAGFEAGADDYVSKPIKPKVLISRIKALLRRFHSSADTVTDESSITSFGKLSIDTERYLVIQDGEEKVLPRKEFKLLRLLTSKPEKVFTREEILEKVWGADVVVGDRTIDVHIRKIREKLSLNQIKTIKGVGYKFTLKDEI
jgi:two-component system alkaline phosphatase synthesis response regulator PhoP